MKWLLLIVGLGLVAGWFYWFQWRPDNIRQWCAEDAKDYARQSDKRVELAEMRYKFCLRSLGIER